MINLLNYQNILAGILAAAITFVATRRNYEIPVEEVTTMYQIMSQSTLVEWIDPSNCPLELQDSFNRIKEETIQQLILEGKGTRETIETFKFEISRKIGKPFPEDMDRVVIAVNEYARPLYIKPEPTYAELRAFMNEQRASK